LNNTTTNKNCLGNGAVPLKYTEMNEKGSIRSQIKAFGLANIGFAGFRISVPSATRNTFANLFP
jgi:hypothetical protein